MAFRRVPLCRSGTLRQYSVIKTLVKELDHANVKPQRAGVIPYVVYNGVTYFGLGLDAQTHDLTDFAGSVFYQNDKTAVNGALREFKEETLDIFQDFDIQDIQDCRVIYDPMNLIIFIHLDVHPDEVSAAMSKRYAEITSTASNAWAPEVCGITWLTCEEFQRSIHEHGTLFTRVRKFLARAENFIDLL